MATSTTKKKTNTAARTAAKPAAPAKPATEKYEAPAAVKKDFVEINSTININVTAGLQLQDATNPDAHVPDRLKVNPLWPKATVQLKQGAHTYPAMIAEWSTVKALAKDKIITIGAFTNDPGEDGAAEKTEELKRSFDEIKARQKAEYTRGGGSLADFAGE